MAAEKYPIAKKDNIVVQELKTEVLIYDLRIDKAYSLNETSAAVFHLCDGRHSVPDITRQLSRKLNMQIREEFVWLALDGLQKESLLQNSSNFRSVFNALERRRIIKKIGLSSMILLPLISSVIAPKAAHAQSGCLSGIVCGFGANTTCCPPASTCSVSGNCCAAGTVVCGPSCCNAGSYCASALGVCCPNGVVACSVGFGFSVCCPSGNCTPSGCSTCPTAQICNGIIGTACCTPTQFCASGLGCFSR